jgi:hypothetical protein
VFDDPAVLELIGKIKLVPDASVSRLCCVIHAELDDGNTLIETMNKTIDDYNYDRAQLKDLIIRVCAEVGVGPEAFDVLSRFVDDPKATGIQAVLNCFSALRKQTAS